jgi:hypothetical protein
LHARRTILTTFALGVAAMPLSAAGAQQTGRVWRIGSLDFSRSACAQLFQRLRGEATRTRLRRRSEPTHRVAVRGRARRTASRSGDGIGRVERRPDHVSKHTNDPRDKARDEDDPYRGVCPCRSRGNRTHKESRPARWKYHRPVDWPALWQTVRATQRGVLPTTSRVARAVPSNKRVASRLLARDGDGCADIGGATFRAPEEIAAAFAQIGKIQAEALVLLMCDLDHIMCDPIQRKTPCGGVFLTKQVGLVWFHVGFARS